MDYRFAEEKDISLVMDFVRALAKYEKLEDQVVADEDTVRYWLFEKEKSEVVF